MFQQPRWEVIAGLIAVLMIALAWFSYISLPIIMNYFNR